MKILYLGYWPSADGLTQSVIVPRLEILSACQFVEEIIFCSVERGEAEPLRLNIPKVTQLFYFSIRKLNVFFTKRADLNGMLLMNSEAVLQNKISLIICNSPLAGIIGYKLYKKNRIPFVVECFEPHALYMREAGAWGVWDPRYWMLTYFEWQQKRNAFKLATVSQAYSDKLVADGVPMEKIATVPNCVPLSAFRFDGERRISMRRDLGIQEQDCVGIYVGKFGDIYYDEEAFDLFAAAFKYFGKNFKLIILTSAARSMVSEKIKRRDIPAERVHLTQVPRQEVPSFLSAADFAFSTIRPSPSRIYCCPIKDGEYWANGLPILLEEGIGEDSSIIHKEGGGIILDRQNANLAFEKLSEILRKGRAVYADEIFSIAVNHRRMELLVDYYNALFDRQPF